MSQSIRFLGLAIFAWVGVRAASLGLVPGADALALDRASTDHGAALAEPSLPPIAATILPPVGAAAPAYVPPPGSAGAAAYPYPPMAYGGAAYGWPAYVPVPAAPSVQYVVQGPQIRPVAQSVAEPAERQWAAFIPLPDPRPFPERPVLDDYPTLRMAASAPVPGQSTPMLGTPALSPTRPYDRWELSSWAMMRERPGPASLASRGMLGGSQGGARLLWRFDPRLAVSARVTTPLQSVQRGTEMALGVRYQPFRSIPVALTAERRQWVGKTPGRSGFALMAEGGLYNMKLPLGARLDSYLQAGIVGPKQRDWFVDGSATASHPIWRGLSAGVGVWGGAQSGLARIEAGPRMSLDLGRGLKAHADYRVKFKGNAEPGSGAVLTLAGDF